mmetsp:Transcript_19427/g.29937  ORF Transcript_19427/g.29937 Transcript_19427/m.29937 type:complete len:258 (-) Transcript_19427:1085-1858(-)|eukprot:CAMPEP_0196804228 /NCGR_PEP_ID=MMETSP1362-20130617/3795_1 /TAXON_ID=163516 /ORGANISM="Leptocylindrus danicus, Strain CCMP1856" /LENGTH=257 /DNA_ID=CAMNT_0042176369 /DNA_START=73 /DNA_END=846 /DNA_ORIENTATION=-
MRLSASLIATQAEELTNTVGERCILLRQLNIPYIENLAVLGNKYDAVDLTGNHITKLANFPRKSMERLQSLYVADNAIEAVDGKNLSKTLINLKNLDLSGNKIGILSEVSKLNALRKLEVLSLLGNPVSRRQHYRLYVINQIDSLKILDYQKVTQKERAQAKRLALSSAGAALEEDVQEEAKTFVPGAGRTAEEAFSHSFTPEQKQQIREMIEQADDPEEIDVIEASVARGEFPAFASRKRKSFGDGDDAGKKARTE